MGIPQTEKEEIQNEYAYTIIKRKEVMPVHQQMTSCP